ncbi:MAG TPA: hypothetical protein VGM90_30840 [Kofleriaceae bacterium]
MSKRRWIVGVVGICLAWRWLHGTPAAPEKPPVLQLAVLKDGFAIAEAMNDRHLIELDSDGKRRKRWAIPLLGDLRVVGSTVGSTLAWVDTKDKVLRLAPLKKDGELGASTAFGRNAAQLCNGAASTSSGFAVAWQAGDGGLWFVRGPLERKELTSVDGAKVSEVNAAAMTCAVRSAGEDVALFWRSGRNMEFDFCAKTGCQGLRARVPLAAGDQVADVACQANGCAVALRSDKGVRLVAFDLRGKQRWQTVLTPVTGEDVHLIAGPRAYLVAFKTPERNEVDRVLASNGSKELVGHTDGRLTVPVISVSRDRVAAAWIDRGEVQTYVRYLDF